jgi:integrase/recombinase XerD
MYQRLRWLKMQTNNDGLKQKTFGMHILRHSIATHLLQSGMKLEHISRFLGHKSLETTQKYTHLANEEMNG